MKKRLAIYIVFWIFILGLFNLVVFLVPSKYDIGVEFAGQWIGFSLGRPASFWVEYGLVVGAFVIHLILALITLSEKNEKKRVRNMPVEYLCYAELYIIGIAGAVCMALYNVPDWLGIIICYSVLFISVFLLFIAKKVEEDVQSANQRVMDRTSEFRGIMDFAQQISLIAKGKDCEQSVKKVYEAIRYSEPISYDETREIEDRMIERLKKLKQLVLDDAGTDMIGQETDELLLLVEERKTQCSAAKRQI